MQDMFCLFNSYMVIQVVCVLVEKWLGCVELLVCEKVQCNLILIEDFVLMMVLVKYVCIVIVDYDDM